MWLSEWVFGLFGLCGPMAYPDQIDILKLNTSSIGPDDNMHRVLEVGVSFSSYCTVVVCYYEPPSISRTGTQKTGTQNLL